VLHDEELGDIGLCSSPSTQDGETLEVGMRRQIIHADVLWEQIPLGDLRSRWEF